MTALHLYPVVAGADGIIPHLLRTVYYHGPGVAKFFVSPSANPGTIDRNRAVKARSQALSGEKTQEIANVDDGNGWLEVE